MNVGGKKKNVIYHLEDLLQSLNLILIFSTPADKQ